MASADKAGARPGIPPRLPVGAAAPSPPDTLRSEEEIFAGWGTDATQPLVNVRCTTFNHVDYIADALRGFLIQETPFPFTIVVHDDASTDGTADILEDFRRRYPRIMQVIRQPENIYSKGDRPRRHMAPFLKGKYIALCEGDDYWIDPHKLATQIDFLERHPDYVISGHRAFSRVGPNVEADPYAGLKWQHDWSASQLKQGDAYIPTATRVYRNVLFDEPYESRFILNGDALLLSRLGSYGKAKFHPEIRPSCYRRHAGGIWSMVAEDDQVASSVSSRLWIARYHRRVGDDATARAFDKNANRTLLRRTTLPQLILEIGRRIPRGVRWIVARVVPWMVRPRA
jgi:glycosyltransferase involved in cell wall biosynthesis